MPSTQALPCAEKYIRVKGARLAYFERGAAFRGLKPTLLFAHATGFHARVWDRIIDKLGDFHSISVDQRGHGRSEKKEIRHWDEVIMDMTELIERLDLHKLVAVGHSMGGHVLIAAAARCEQRFLKIIAIDPVILAEADYRAASMPAGAASTHPTAKRRRHFDSPQEMADRLRSKGSFGLFDRDVLMDYCTHGLLPDKDGKGYVLACPPEIEAGVYLSSRSGHGIFTAIRALTVPVLILRAKEPDAVREPMDFSSSPTWPRLHEAFRNGREIHFPDKTHFLPMQIPDEIRAIISAEIAGVRQG